MEEDVTRFQEDVTRFQDLPQELFGLIYGYLRSTDRMHFFHSCREVHDADSVLRQIYRLELRDQDVTQISRFPSKATLRVLKINKRTNLPVVPWTREVQPCGDLQGPPLKLLWDYIASANLCLDSVQEIHLHGYNLQESSEVAPLALHCPCLTTLTLSNIRIKLDAQVLQEMTAGCRHLHTVDAIASDYTSLEAIVTGLAALQDKLKVLRIAGTNNALRLRSLQCMESLEELDLSYQNDTVLGLDFVLRHCHNLKVLRLGEYTPSLCIAGSPSLEHVEFKRLHMMLHLFPKLDQASCPGLRRVTVHSIDFTTLEDDDIEALVYGLEERLHHVASWPLQWGGGQDGSHLTLIDSSPQTPGRRVEAPLSALSAVLASSPAAALVRNLSLHRSRLPDCLLAPLASTFPNTSHLDLEHVPSSSALIAEAARCFPSLERMRMCMPRSKSNMQTYKHCWAACRVDYLGLAKACVAATMQSSTIYEGSSSNSPCQVRVLVVDLLEPQSANPQLRWDERKWQQVLHDTRERELRMRLKAGASFCTRSQTETVIRCVSCECN